jgi:hypothetical protein
MIPRFLQESRLMGAATTIRSPAVGPGAVLCAAALLLALPATVSCAGAQGGAREPVRVEWMLSDDRALAILNAYRINDGALASPATGLLIERDPSAVGSARMLHQLNRGGGYAVRASRAFFGMLQCTSALDAIANGGKHSGNQDEFSPEEWKRLLDRLLDPGAAATLKTACRMEVREVAPEVRQRFAPEIPPLFRDGVNPVLPHLRAPVSLVEPSEEPVVLGQVSIGDTVVKALRLETAGTLPLDLRLRFDSAMANAGFSAAGEGPVRVSPGSPGEVRIAFAPRTEGRRGGTVDLLLGNTAVGYVRLEGTGRVRPATSGPLAWLHRLQAATVENIGAAIAVVLLFLLLARRARAELLPAQVRPGAAWLATLRRGRGHPPTGARDTGARGGDPHPQLAAVLVQLNQAATAISGAIRHIDVLRSERNGATPGGTDGQPADPAAATVFTENEAPDLRRVRELEAERERFRQSADALTGQVSGLSGENQSLRAEKALLAQQKEDADQEVRRLRGETDRLGNEQQRSWARLRELAQPLGLTDDMLADDRWAETRRELSLLRAAYTPRFVANFEQLVADLVALYEQIGRHAASGRLAAAVNVVLNGANADNGLRAVAEGLGQDALLARLGLERARDLRRLTPERFWRELVDPQFRPVIDNVAKLGLYARSRSPEIDMGRRLDGEGVDPAQLESALALVETRLRADFQIELHTVRLFEERFDAAAHETARHSTLVHTLPELDPLIGRLPPRTVYDVTSVGVRAAWSVTRPVVAWVSSAA